MRFKKDNELGHTFLLELNVGFDKASNESPRKSLKPLISSCTLRDSTHHIVQKMFLSINSSRVTIMTIKYLQDKNTKTKGIIKAFNFKNVNDYIYHKKKNFTPKTEKAEEGSPGTLSQSVWIRKKSSPFLARAAWPWMSKGFSSFSLLSSLPMRVARGTRDCFVVVLDAAFDGLILLEPLILQH